MRIIKFKPIHNIRRRVGSGKNLVVFFTGTEYEGELYKDGTIICDYAKHPGIYKVGGK